MRFGEMERDCMLSHGVASILKERLPGAHVFYAGVCGICGKLGNYNTNKKAFFCQGCRNHKDYAIVCLPSAFKLLIQELMSMHIMPRLRTDGRAGEALCVG